ncbi:MAG TPA: hypothetical protein VN441_07300 [Syntrophomonas sp.]|jgi:hypothetical protein|nr:hypothetical protein [Syntrophomonas sp.]
MVGQEIRSTGQPTREDEISMQYTIEFPLVKTGEASTIGVRYNDLQIKPMEGLRVKIPLK